MKLLCFYTFIIFLNEILVSAKILHLEDLNIEEIVKNLGCALENYTVYTDDGYTLFLHRLKHRFKKNNRKQGPPVLLMPGLIGSSVDWLVTGRTGLASMLLNKGYDVWMGNTRSSPFSRPHVKKTDLAYNNWDYSWHEMGIYDIPRIIDKLLSITKRNKTLYVGFSQGGTEFFVLTSMFPEYNDKIELMVGLAPAVYTGTLDAIPQFMARVITYPLMWFTERFGHFTIMFSTSLLKILTSVICRSDSYIIQTLCIILPYFSGDTEVAKPGILSKYLLYSSYKGSSKQFLHYAQFVYSPDEFHMYDYGKEKNKYLYNNTKPPSYPLEKVKAPVYIFHSTVDTVVSSQSIQLLKQKIKNCIGTYAVKTFKHIDFMFGKERTPMFQKVVDVIESIVKINKTTNILIT